MKVSAERDDSRLPGIPHGEMVFVELDWKGEIDHGLGERMNEW